MKSIFLSALLALSLGANAFAYTSPQGSDPVNGSYEVETKVVMLSDATDYSDAVTKGHGMFYEDGSGGLVGLAEVSRNYSGTYNTALASKVTACIAAKSVATGAEVQFPCVTRGYVDFAIYDATAGITKGDYLCVSNLASVRGKLVACATGITSPFVALETKASGSGTDLKVAVQAR